MMRCTCIQFLRTSLPLVLAALLALPAAQAQESTVTVGVLSFRPMALAQTQWQPLIDHLNRSVPEARFELKIYDYPAQQEAVRLGRVDLLLTQPAEYVRLVHENGLSSPLATLIQLEQNQPVRAMGGVILVRSDRTDLRELRDLQGQRIATISRSSFGAYQMQYGELVRAGTRPGAIEETGSPQDLSVQAVLEGRADAAFVRTGLIESMAREGRLDLQQVKLLNAQNYRGYPFALSTRLYPEWPVVAMPHLPEALSVRVAGALLSVPQGSALARSMGLYGFTIPADYEPVRAMMRDLRLPPFDAPSPITWHDLWTQYRLPIATLTVALLLVLAMTLREMWLRQRLTSFGNAMGEGMFVLNRQGHATYVNRAACELLGYPREALLGRPLLAMIVAPQTQPQYFAGINPLAHPQRWQQAYEGENLFIKADGQSFPAAVSSQPVLRKGKFVRSVTVFSDISERKAHNEHIYQLAYHDSLTGLPNRRLLLERLQEALSRDNASGQGALLFSDLDRFKQINDTLGHKVGDALLQAVAARMVKVVGGAGMVAHTGGDEFAVLLDQLDADPQRAVEQARAMAEQLRSSLREPFGIDSNYHQMSISLGVVMFDGPHTAADELLKRADIAMYQAKAGGRNTIRFFDHVIEAQLSQQVALEADLQLALTQHQFIVHYQPQFDGTGQLVGAEALVRWMHPQRGLVMPGQFIPLAEETGLILPLGQWVLEQACVQIERWREHPLLSRMVVSVNVCAHQLLQANFVESVTAILMASGADPAKLQLELTESVLADNVEDVIDKMRRLVALGVNFSLDDFGTGYSSLSYLKRLPLQQLKIDSSFVRDLETDPNDVAITHTILALGRSLGLEVIAEGVENAPQRDILQQQGCQLFQGYLYSRPVSPAELAQRFGVHGANPVLMAGNPARAAE